MIAAVGMDAAAGIAFAIVGDQRTARRPGGEPEVQVASRLLIPVGERAPAPGFSVATTSGTQFSLGDARGRVVVFSFLAPGCADCTAEVQALKAVHESLGAKGAQALLVDVGDISNAEILHYYRRELDGGDHLYAEDVEYRVAKAYEVRLLRTTVVVDHGARIAYRDEDLTTARKLLAVVRQALREA